MARADTGGDRGGAGDIVGIDAIGCDAASRVVHLDVSLRHLVGTRSGVPTVLRIGATRLLLSGMRRPDPHEARARELAVAAGLDPDSRIERPGQRSMPAWCAFRDAARAEAAAKLEAQNAAKATKRAATKPTE